MGGLKAKSGSFLLFFGLVACMGHETIAPVEEGIPRAKVHRPSPVKPSPPRPKAPPPFYRVAPGDTLYGIAWKYRLDPRTLARWNRIPPPYIIYPGQRLRLTPPKSTPARPLPSKTPKIRKAPPPPPRKAVAKKGIPWTWPAFGRVISTFSPRDPNRKGIDIAGRKGQLVYAAAPGKVVYSGSGLVGYGKLIIIKHNENYLSAYAHNERLLVKEGDQVRAGQPIAVMGKTGTDRVKLHFEIRYRGKPVDPLKFLPKNRHSPKEVADGTKAKGDVF